MKMVDLSSISVTDDEILRCMGYGGDNCPSQETEDRMKSLQSQIKKISPAKGLFTRVPVSEVKKRGIETSHGFIESSRIAKISGNTEYLLFSLVTLGDEFDRRSDEFSDMVDSYIWDAIGTAYAEGGVITLMKMIEDEMGKTLSLPFSPGYCDWPLSGQKTIFSAFGDAPSGITLEPDSFVMTPRKSVSFIACPDRSGAGKNPCRLCNMKNCFMRRDE